MEQISAAPLSPPASSPPTAPSLPSETLYDAPNLAIGAVFQAKSLKELDDEMRDAYGVISRYKIRRKG